MPTLIDRRGPARLTDEQYVELLRNLGNEIPEHLRPTPFEEEYVRELRLKIKVVGIEPIDITITTW